MRALFLAIVTLTIHLVTLTDAAAQVEWDFLGSPTSPVVESVVLAPDGGIYCIAGRNSAHFDPAGLFHSSDDGATWREIQLPGTPTGVMACDANGRFYLGSEDAVYISDDRGARFTALESTIGLDVYGIAFGNDGSSVLLNTVAGMPVYYGMPGVYYSDDRGATFVQLEDPSDTSDWYIQDAVVTSDGTIYAIKRKPFPSHLAEVLKSADGGTTWSEPPVNPADAPRHIYIRGDDGLIVFSGTGIFETIDEGTTWVVPSAGFFISTFGSFIRHDGHRRFFALERDDDMLAPLSDHMVYTEDSFESWIRDVGLPYDPFPANIINDVAIASDGTLYTATDYGLLIREAATETWRFAGVFGGGQEPAYRLYRVPGQRVLVQTHTNTFRMEDGSDEWLPVTRKGLPVPALREIVRVQDDTLVGHRDGYLYLSGDDGLNWPVRLEMQFMNSISDLAADPSGTIYAVGLNHIGCVISEAPFVKSTDNGYSWTVVDSSNTSWHDVESDPEGNIYTLGNGLRKYPADGSASTFLRHFTGSKLFATNSGSLYAFDYDTLLISTNQGEDWSDVQYPFTERIMDLAVNSADQAAVLNLGQYNPYIAPSVWYNPGPGANWQDITGDVVFSNEYNDGYDILFDETDRLYLGTSDGVFRTTQAVLPVRESPQPVTSELPSTYPNPVSAGQNTSLTFGMARSGEVTLTLYSLLGTRVRDVALGWKSIGAHQYRLPTRGLAPGVYQLVLRGGGTVRTAKVVVTN